MQMLQPDYNAYIGSTQDVELTAGQVIPAPVGSHAVENIGDTEVQTIGVELK